MPRVFERRLGSRKFFCRLVSSLLLTTALEVAATGAVGALARANNRPDFSGILAVGPLYLVFPWFFSFYRSIPSLSSVATPLGNLGIALSTKSLTYFVGFNLLVASNANLVAGVAGIVRDFVTLTKKKWQDNNFVLPSPRARLPDFSFTRMHFGSRTGSPFQMRLHHCVISTGF